MARKIKKPPKMTFFQAYGRYFLAAGAVVVGAMLYGVGRDLYAWIKEQGKEPETENLVNMNIPKNIFE